jgi:hypothetical protein
MADVTAKLAEALQPFVTANNSGEFETLTVRTTDITKAREALRLYDAAKEQPMQAEEPAMSPKQTSGTSEPVAWRVWRGDSYELFFNEEAAKRRCECFIRQGKPEPLYAAPVAQAEPVAITDKQLLAEAEFAESYDASAPSFMRLLRDDAVVGDFQRRLLICMRAAVKLAAPVAQAEPWQPIETAPKDGRKLVLSYTNSHGKHRTVFGCWVTDEEAAETDADGVGLEAGWYESIDNWPDYTQVAIHEGEPTHWMPLPQPPKENKHD